MSTDLAMMTISICIPTYCRPKLLQEAVKSCLQQSRLPDEIVIEDNSPDDVTEQMVQNLQAESPVPIVYAHARERRGQADNFNSMVHRVASSHFVLLHDDDLLLPNALEDLSACWDRRAGLTAAYGKQYLMSEQGDLDLPGSERLQAAYFRTPDREGLQEYPWFPGLAQQFPNDGFMLRTAAARDILWRPSQRNGCEFDFGLRLGLKFEGFCFIDRYTMKSRMTNVSMSKSKGDDAALYSFRILGETPLPEMAETLRRKRLREFAPRAVVQAIQTGHRAEALRIYWGEFYPWGRRLSPGGIFQLARFVLPERVVAFLRSQARNREA